MQRRKRMRAALFETVVHVYFEFGFVGEYRESFVVEKESRYYVDEERRQSDLVQESMEIFPRHTVVSLLPIV